MAVDSLGNAYIAGFTTATNFPTAHAAQPQLAGNTDGFLAKVDTTGSQLVYSTYLGGAVNDFGRGIAVDATGESVHETGPREWQARIAAEFPNLADDSIVFAADYTSALMRIPARGGKAEPLTKLDTTLPRW